MKAAASDQDSTVPFIDQALTFLPASAQQQIEALRAAIDVRLAALDAVLADPTRGESLETLILDLARLATEEARASATRACVGIKLETDNEIAQIRKSAGQSLEHERIVSSDFRRSLEQAEQRYAALERDKQTELRALRDQFDAKVSGDRTALDAAERAVGNLERALAEARKQIETERAASAALLDDVARIEAQAAVAAREQGEARNKVTQAEQAAEQERQRSAETAKAHATTQADLATERATVAELRGAVERMRGQTATADRDREEAKKASAALEADLVRERQIAATLEQNLREAAQQTEAERKAAAELRQAIAKTEEQGVTLRREHALAQASSKGIAAALDRERQAVADLNRAQEVLTTQLETERQLTQNLRALQTKLEQKVSTADQQASMQSAGQDELREALLTARNSAQTLQADLEKERQASTALRSRLDEAETRMSRADKDTAHSVAGQEELRQALANARNERQTLTTALEAEKKASAEMQGRLDQAGKQLVTAKAEIERLTRQAAQTSSQAATGSELQQSLEQAHADARRLQTELEAERQSARTLHAEQERILLALERATTTANRSEEQLAEYRATTDTAALRDQLKNVEQTLAATLTEHEKLVAALDLERAKVQELERTRATADSARRDTEKRASTSAARGKSASAAAAAAEPPPAPFAAAPAKPAQNKGSNAYAVNDAGWTQVRMSTRYAFRDHLEIQVNSGGGSLCDLSIGGCQLLSRTALKPKQSVKVTLPFREKGLLCTGKVIWARVEPPTAGQPLSYRAGVQFSNADQAAIEAFLKNHGVDV